MQLLEPTQALCQQWQLGDLESVGQALLALTAFGKGEGQLLLWDGKSFVTVIAARNGEWDERLIGKLSTPDEEIFAFKALNPALALRTPHSAPYKIVFAPTGLMKGAEPVAHCAVFLRSHSLYQHSAPSTLRLVLTLDMPLPETVPASPLDFLRFPRKLLSQIALRVWRGEIPPKLLSWVLWGRTGVFIWDGQGRLRWCPKETSERRQRGEGQKIGDLTAGLTIRSDFVALKTDVGTVIRYRESTPTVLRGYSLLRSEVHHRVKNDLQSIISLLRFQARNAPPEARKVLLDAAERVRAFAAVHDLLARSRGDTVNLRELAQQLAQWASERARGEGKNIQCVVTGPDISIAPKQASAVASVLHELLLNACKHAFAPDSIGTVAIAFNMVGEILSIEVADNGRGFNPDQLDGSTLGLTIVRNLVEQDLGGTLEVISSLGRGTKVLVKFPLRALP
ncbi:sensor histidine kinase [Fervidibacter sacchari]